MTGAVPIGRTLQALGHYVDQPDVIHGVWRQVGKVGVAGAGLQTAVDVVQTPSDGGGRAKAETAIQNLAVLGAAAAGTAWATKRWMVPEPEAVRATAQDLAALAQHYSPRVLDLLHKTAAKTPAEFREIIHGILTQSTRTLAERKADLAKALPLPEPEGFAHSLKEMGAFFGVGGVSVLSGLAGGVASSHLLHPKQAKAQTTAMIKEGIFQFVANIALCAVGAAAGLLAIEKLNITNRLARTGMIGAGLSVGIFGGGKLANWVGRHLVDPAFARLSGRPAEHKPAAVASGANRQVGFSDMILHLDDVPTAMALAGVEVIKPFVPLFFLYSGYRTGTAGRREAAAPAQESLPADYTPSHLATRQNVAFQGFRG